MPRKGIDIRKLMDGASESFRRRNSDLEDRIARTSDTQPQRDAKATLVKASKDSAGMVEIACPVLVRIVRYVPDKRHIQDDDNARGGAKELRDSIAEFLCRKGDSEADGMYWEYETVVGKPFGVEVEIYEKSEAEISRASE